MISESHNTDPYTDLFLQEDLAKAQRFSVLIYLFKFFAFFGSSNEKRPENMPLAAW